MVRVFLILSLVATLKGELITLTVVPNNLSTSTYSTDNGSAVVEITNSGTVEADITLDPFTRNPTNVTFIGGTLFYSDANSVYTPNTPPQTDNLIISGEGGFSAIGTLQLPSSAFQSWIDNHQAINQPPLLIYSLGLPPSQNQLPLIFTTNEATLTLPDSGTLAEVTLQHSSDLQTWSNLQTFPAGITGIQIIPLPQSKVAYVRLALP